jgi:hypothetical protein
MTSPFPAVPRELQFLFPGGRPMDTGVQNFMQVKPKEVQEAIEQAARKLQGLWDDMNSTMVAEIMVPLGNPEEMASVLDRLAVAATELAALVRK